MYRPTAIDSVRKDRVDNPAELTGSRRGIDGDLHQMCIQTCHWELIVEIVVIDGSDNDNSYLKSHRAAVSNALIVSSVENMVNRIRDRLGATGTIDRLVIVGHGNSGVIGV